MAAWGNRAGAQGTTTPEHLGGAMVWNQDDTHEVCIGLKGPARRSVTPNSQPVRIRPMLADVAQDTAGSLGPGQVRPRPRNEPEGRQVSGAPTNKNAGRKMPRGVAQELRRAADLRQGLYGPEPMSGTGSFPSSLRRAIPGVRAATIHPQRPSQTTARPGPSLFLPTL